MKYLIVGLGNIGQEYEQTRHNIGFDVLDRLVANAGESWSAVSHGDKAVIRHKGRTLCLIKPNTYMNSSGTAVRHWLTKEKIPVERLLVVVDDIHLELGMRRLRAKGSAGGHNGLKDIESRLGLGSYPRLRLGVGNDFRPGRQVEYVLGRWEEDEIEPKEAMVKSACDCVLDFASLEFKYAVQQCNGR